MAAADSCGGAAAMKRTPTWEAHGASRWSVVDCHQGLMGQNQNLSLKNKSTSKLDDGSPLPLVGDGLSSRAEIKIKTFP